MLCFTVLPPDYLKKRDSKHTGNPEKNICFHKHSPSQLKMLVAVFTSPKLFYEYIVTPFTVSGQVQSSEIQRDEVLLHAQTQRFCFLCPYLTNE